MRDPEFITIDVSSVQEPSAPIKLVEFPADVLERFTEILTREVVPYSPFDLTLRTVALSYKAQKNGTSKTERAAKRERQRKAAKTAQKALDAIDQLQTGDIVPFVMEGGDEAYNKFRALTRLLEHWSPVMEAVAKRKLPRGREESDLLTNFCGCLKAIYEEHSGQVATHNTMFEAIDASEPLSSFGRFVVTMYPNIQPRSTDFTSLTATRRVR